MNKLVLIVASLFAVTAFAAEPAKVETAKPVEVTVTAKKPATPAKSAEPAVKNEKAAAKPAATSPAK